MKLSFMTFVCPDWELEQVVAFARDAHYDGVELRVDSGHKHGVSSATSAADRQRVKRLFADAGVEIPCVATSVHLASPDPVLHAENLAVAKANLTLAADLGAPIVRMFAGGKIPALTPEAAAQVASALDELGAWASPLGVAPMLECGHDIIKGASEAGEVLSRVQEDNVGALWNYSTIDDETFAVLRDRLRHFHVHDPVLEPENDAILTLARKVKSIDYQGYVSLEIIHGENLPEELLRATATRLKGYMAQA